MLCKFFGSVLLALAVSFLWAENLSIILKANDYEVIDLNKGEQAIKMEEFGSLHESGKPMLPAKVFLIGLPPGAEVQDVMLEGIGEVELPGSYEIVPSPPPVPTASGEEIEKWLEFTRQKWEENYETTYSSDEIYPEKVGEYLGSGNLRKYRFARVSYLPFAYHPLSKRLVFRPSVRVSIDYILPVPGSSEAMEVERLLTDRIAEPLASELLVNYQTAKNWYPPLQKSQDSRQPYDYVIITSSGLTSAVNPLVSWKTSLGYNVNVVTTDWINMNYSGTDLQERIRNFLIDKYPSSRWGDEKNYLIGTGEMRTEKE